MLAGPKSGLTAVTSTPGEAAALAAAPIFSVIERVVFGLMAWMCMRLAPGCRATIGPPDPLVNCDREPSRAQAAGLRVSQRLLKAWSWQKGCSKLRSED